jgi:hypothetical protein
LGALDFFCINDTTDDAHPDDPRLLEVQSVLQAMLPQASVFEQSRSRPFGRAQGARIASACAKSSASKSAQIHQKSQVPADHQSPVSGTGSRRRA